MFDPLSWAFPLGRFFGIPVRVHIFFPVVASGLILYTVWQKNVIPGTWIDATMLMALLFVIVLLHELGHCFGARAVDGDAQQVLMWPLGGLAYVDVPHTPRANFIATVSGPAVNVIICVLSALALLSLTSFDVRLPWNPLPPPHGWSPYRVNDSGQILLYHLDGTEYYTSHLGELLAVRTFWGSWVLLLLNVLIPGFPLDGGRMFQCAVWWWKSDYRQGTILAVYAGFVSAIGFGIYGIAGNEALALALAVFVFWECQRQFVLLEHGGEDALLGYDFSQGYTSLERDQPAPRRRRRRQSFWQRWWQERARRKLQRQQEQREAEERRMDELLAKVQQKGLQSLSEEERRFLKRVSDKYRNRQ